MGVVCNVEKMEGRGRIWTMKRISECSYRDILQGQGPGPGVSRGLPPTGRCCRTTSQVPCRGRRAPACMRKGEGQFTPGFPLLPFQASACKCFPKKIFFFVVLLGLHSQDMEVARLGVKLELWLPAYATATARPNLSHVCDLHHSSGQHASLIH